MRYRHFVTYNVVGALLWAVGVTLLGYLLGNFTFIKENIEAILRHRRGRPLGDPDRRRAAARPAARPRDERRGRATRATTTQAERDEVERKAFGA